MIFRSLFISFFLFICFTAYSSSSYTVFTQNGKQGLKDNEGKIVIPPKFEALGWSFTGHEVKNNSIGFLQNGKWGLLSLNNQVLYPAQLDAIFDVTKNYIVAGEKQINGRYRQGLITYQGEEVIPFEYAFLKVEDTNIIARKDRLFGLLDFRNKIVLPFIYSDIRHIGDLRWAAWNSQNKAALFNSEGKQLTEFLIDSIENYSGGLVTAWKNHQSGILNREGNWVLPASYKSIQVSNKEIIGKRFNAYSIFKADGKVDLEVDSVVILPNKIFHVFANDRQWLLNEKFESISPVSQEISVFGNYASIKEGNHFRIFNLGSQSWWKETFFNGYYFLNESLIMVKEHGKDQWTIFHSGTGKLLATAIEKVEIKQHEIRIKRNNHWGILTEEGKEILPPVYDEIILKKDNRYLVRFHRGYGILDINAEWLVPPVDQKIIDFATHHYISFDGLNYNLYTYRGERVYFSTYPLILHHNFVEEQQDNSSTRRVSFKGLSIRSAFGENGYKEVLNLKEGLIGIYHNGMYGFIDPQYRLIIANRYDGIQSFNEGVASVKLRGKWGAIDKSERLIVQPHYDSISYFRQGLAIVRQGNKYGVINTSGDQVISAEYDKVSLLRDGFYLIKKGADVGVADDSGKVLIWPKYDSLYYDNEYFIVEREEEFGVHDKNGIAILPPKYEQILPLWDGRLLIGQRNPLDAVERP